MADRAALEARITQVNAEAKRLPRWHPDYEPTHRRIDRLIWAWQREQAQATQPLRPSQVLAKR